METGRAVFLAGAPYPTVSEVAAQARISRPTFYQNFPDVDSLVAAAAVTYLKDTFAEADARLHRYEGTELLARSIRNLVRVIDVQRDPITDALHSGAGMELLYHLIEATAERMSAKVVGDHLTADASDPDDDRIHAIAAGSVWLILRWLEAPEKTSATALAKRLIRTVFSLADIEPIEPVATKRATEM